MNKVRQLYTLKHFGYAFMNILTQTGFCGLFHTGLRSAKLYIKDASGLLQKYKIMDIYSRSALGLHK